MTSRITWSDDASRKLRFKELTTKEIIACCEDLKVLGKKEFRNLLRWRLAIREELGLSETKEPEEPTGTAVVTEDDQIDTEIARLSAQELAIKKRERRKLNERKQKEVVRMQLGMLTPHELGMEQDAMQSDEFFGLKKVEHAGVMPGLLKGSVPADDSDSDDEQETARGDHGGDNEIDELEAQLDNMYQLL